MLRVVVYQCGCSFMLHMLPFPQNKFLCFKQSEGTALWCGQSTATLALHPAVTKTDVLAQHCGHTLETDYDETDGNTPYWESILMH